MLNDIEILQQIHEELKKADHPPFDPIVIDLYGRLVVELCVVRHPNSFQCSISFCRRRTQQALCTVFSDVIRIIGHEPTSPPCSEIALNTWKVFPPSMQRSSMSSN